MAMSKPNDVQLCRIPVEAVIVIAEDGQAEMVSAEYEDIPADLIAEYLLEHCPEMKRA